MLEVWLIALQAPSLKNLPILSQGRWQFGVNVGSGDGEGAPAQQRTSAHV